MSSIVTERRGKAKIVWLETGTPREPDKAEKKSAASQGDAKQADEPPENTSPPLPPSRRHSIRGEPAPFSRRGRSPVGSRGDTSPRNQTPRATASWLSPQVWASAGERWNNSGREAGISARRAVTPAAEARARSEVRRVGAEAGVGEGVSAARPPLSRPGPKTGRDLAKGRAWATHRERRP